ncbi:hypothetical protein, partial [Intestinibacter sp.]|uniref:hypothetical protein n=1 Tax=Intestinibacter sp. TaxID=1965304 RepID=UPI003F18B93F
GGIGRHEGLKILWLLQLCGFKSRFEYKYSIETANKVTLSQTFTILSYGEILVRRKVNMWAEKTPD